MNNDNINHTKRRSSLKQRAKSFREKTSSHHHKHDSVSINKEFIDSKDINFEIDSNTSSKKKHHRHNNNYKKKGTFKSTFNSQKLKKVSFKENFIEIVQIENWKRYNTELNEDNNRDNEDNGKDKTKCTCVIY